MLPNSMAPNDVSKKLNISKALRNQKPPINKFRKKDLLFYNRSSKEIIRNTRQYKPMDIIESTDDEKNLKNYSSIFNHQNSNPKNSTLFSNYNNLPQNTKTKNSTICRNNSNSIAYSKSCSSYIISNDLLNKSNNYITDMINNEQKNLINIDNNVLQMKKNDNEIENLVKLLNLHNYSHVVHNNSNSAAKISTKFSQTADNFLNKKSTNKKTSAKKYCIEGTNVMSPFCSYARDNFLYKKIFYDSDRNSLKSDFRLDNKLNIIYAENQEKYKQTLIRLNEYFKKIGKKMCYNVEPPLSEIRLRFIKDKIDFIKKIVDYAYPNMVLSKVQNCDNNMISYHNIYKSDIITSKINQNINKSNSRIFGERLGKSFSVKKFYIRK